LFNATVGTIVINVMNDLTSQWKSFHRMASLPSILKFFCGDLPSYYTEEIGSYTQPKLKIGISSTLVRNFMSLCLVPV